MAENKIFLAGCVTFYFPAHDVVHNIESYIKYLDVLYIIDNSSSDNSKLLDGIDEKYKIKYLPQFSNLGIAKALNIAASNAIKENYKYLLTMDQDSKFEPEGVLDLLSAIKTNPNIGIIAPLCIFDSDVKVRRENVLEDAVVVPTSGNIINLDAWSAVGGFTEKLFIDMVDFDFCLKLRTLEYRICVKHSALLYHELGNMKRHRFLVRNIYATHHSPIRFFYRTRNRFYLKKKFENDFPLVIRRELVEFFKELVKIFLYEKQKMKKVKMIIAGYSAYKTDSYGKYEGK